MYQALLRFLVAPGTRLEKGVMATFFFVMLGVGLNNSMIQIGILHVLWKQVRLLVGLSEGEGAGSGGSQGTDMDWACSGCGAKQ